LTLAEKEKLLEGHFFSTDKVFFFFSLFLSLLAGLWIFPHTPPRGHSLRPSWDICPFFSLGWFLVSFVTGND